MRHFAAPAKPPPLIRSRWRRTVLISSMPAPAPSKEPVISCMSRSPSPVCGAVTSEEPPPEMRQINRSFWDVRETKFRAACTRHDAAHIGNRMGGLHEGDAVARTG